MRVFVQDDSHSRAQFIEVGKKHRPIVENVLKIMFGKDCDIESRVVHPECQVWAGKLESNYDVGIHGKARTMLVVANESVDSIVTTLEILGFEIITVTCDWGSTSAFNHHLKSEYSYIWERE